MDEPKVGSGRAAGVEPEVPSRAKEAVASVSDERFHHLIDAVTDYAIFMLDPDGKVSTWNAGAQKTKGYLPEEIIGRHFSVFYTPEDQAAGKPEHILEEVRKHGRAEDESWRMRQDGTRFWANVVITSLRDSHGNLAGYAKVTRDLTERRATEERLRASEERFHHLVDAVTDYAIFMLDPDGKVSTWNAGAQKTKGYLPEEIIGRHFSVFYTPEDQAAGKPEHILEEVRNHGRAEDESWRMRQDGTRFWANVVITSLRDSHGNLAGYAKVTRDLTERRAAEGNERELVREQLARGAAELARHEMELVSRSKDEFLATMSHELRTPLHAISGWAAILRKTSHGDAKLDRGLEVIERNARAQTRLINDLLDVSRIISGKLQLNPERTDVLLAVSAAVDGVKPSAEAQGVRLVVDVDPSVGSTVADPDRLQQIIANILSNAVRFTPRGNRVTITADRHASGIRISVRDTGAGIAPEQLPHIFKRFRQVDSSITRSHGGLGLGLAIVQHLVEAHGGKVTAESEGLGKGSTFTFILPILAVSLPVGEPDGSAPAAGPRILEHTRVLIVDDDPDSLDVLRGVLEGAGATVTSARSAEEALATLDASGPYALIVSDVGMPNTDGYAFMQQVRSHAGAAAVPAIALTAYAHASDAEQALSSGFQEHLTKPVDERRLLRAVATWSQVTLRTAAKDRVTD